MSIQSFEIFFAEIEMLVEKVSRKVIGSNNRRKAVKKLAKIHELIFNLRNDFQHKVSKKANQRKPSNSC